jgi:hypothetical protein
MDKSAESFPGGTQSKSWVFKRGRLYLRNGYRTYERDRNRTGRDYLEHRRFGWRHDGGRTPTLDLQGSELSLPGIGSLCFRERSERRVELRALPRGSGGRVGKE